MASTYSNQLHSAALLLLFILCLCPSSAFSNPKPFLSLPIFKQAVTGRYVAKIFHGTYPYHQSTDLVLDLGDSVTKLPCHLSSLSTHRFVSCPSLQCSKAGGSAEVARSGDQLVEDVVTVGSVDSVKSTVDRFLFYCAVSRRSAVLGLGRSKMSLPSQFSMTHFLDRKFSLCLSASGDGSRLLIGDALAGTDISKTLIYTPLLTDSQSNPTQHFIPVESIKIRSNDPDPVKVNGRARLSTTTSFTTLKSSIYNTVVKKFVKAVITSSLNTNVTVVTDQSALAPFKTCFVHGESNVVFPDLDLVLQSEMVKWKIGGGNLMVAVDEKNKSRVSCLGILDGGSEIEDEIVIGRFQLMENVMEFDMGRSMLGFGTSSASCGELKQLDTAGRSQSFAY